ncbi:hypothetical protein PHYSODRAFT_322935 [Phytophthora sojae]|uniref:Peptide chain release factor N(5)-glutamine methyltransferase n=1 Tax=Phytophthora sojae (strain P6497) TaxID=1094619 RepID=G4YJ77_PHYSP|nr:hypothetical protein PHYSODRAFT_322935 [Phytophthora sojae]EGZ29411.1 hypothetical protein PHYSODRAFT_322935 [Phytophthora sojae]|eukprot:XP_009516686.1 hypothetical protein PHYSODRAFT_322935 [Phytophthora sojae]
MHRTRCFLRPALRRLLDARRRRIHSGQTVEEAVQETRERLSRVSGALASSAHESARTDAKALAANALLPPLASSSDVFFHGERELTEHEAARLSAGLERRARGEPLAYVLGRKEFWSLEFTVTKDTLIPRSDSEVLIETLTEQFEPQTPLRILDIGTGSGCLLLSALSEFPAATGVGIDVSPGALAVAKQNARSNGLDGRAEFVLRDLQTLPGLREDAQEDKLLYQQFDVILCNPPYIPSRELPLVGADVLEYEPHLALFSDGGPAAEDTGEDPDGLRMYRFLHQSIAKLFKGDNGLAPETNSAPNNKREQTHDNARSCLLLEIGSEEQARAVQQLFSDSALEEGQLNRADCGSRLQFERFLFDASGKYRGLLFLS